MPATVVSPTPKLTDKCLMEVPSCKFSNYIV